MTERPILFSGPMVRAILEGRKTQTRRPVKPQPVCGDGIVQGPNGLFFVGQLRDSENAWRDILCPCGVPGDRLWVRETFWDGRPDIDNYVLFVADGYSFVRDWKKRPSIFMPRWASRITLEITDVRVQRVQETSAADCIAEGLTADLPMSHADWRDSFAGLWDSINEKRGFGWDANPWVWALTFGRV
jgi:hypothetical protein